MKISAYLGTPLRHDRICHKAAERAGATRRGPGEGAILRAQLGLSFLLVGEICSRFFGIRPRHMLFGVSQSKNRAKWQSGAYVAEVVRHVCDAQLDRRLG